MVRLIAVLALLWGPAWGQEVVQSGSDTIEIRASQTHFAEVVYSNGITQNSNNLRQIMAFDDLEVIVVIEVNPSGTKGRERITVEPVDSAFVAVPASAEVEDGESIVIQIMQPMF